MACRKRGVEPGAAIRPVAASASSAPPAPRCRPRASTGSTSSSARSVLLNVGSGGTDVCTGIVQGSPMQPVYAGEIAGRCLGVDAAAFDEDGAAGGRRARRAGDHARRCRRCRSASGATTTARGTAPRTSTPTPASGATATGSCSPSAAAASSPAAPTRPSTAAASGSAPASSTRWSRSCDEVVDSLVVHLEDPEGGAGELILFVVPADGHRARRRAARRGSPRRCAAPLSPRHVPDTIDGGPRDPEDADRKKLEVPVKRILLGAPPERWRAATRSRDPQRAGRVRRLRLGARLRATGLHHA